MPSEQPPGPLRECTGAHCTQQVFFAQVHRRDGTLGKPQPFNWPPQADGLHHQQDTLDGTVVVVHDALATGPGYMPHHATCPDVASFGR